MTDLVVVKEEVDSGEEVREEGDLGEEDLISIQFSSDEG